MQPDLQHSCITSGGGLAYNEGKTGDEIFIVL